MKYLLTLSLFIFSINSLAQDTVSIKSRRIVINSINNTSVEIFLKVDFDKDGYSEYKIDDDSFHKKNYSVIASLASKRCKTWINRGEKIEINVTNNSNEIFFSIVNLSNEFIHLLKDSIADFYILTNKDIFFDALKNDDVLTMKSFKISIGQIERNSRKNISLTESMLNELITARGGTIFFTQNQIGFGLIPAENSSSKKTEYNVSFKYRSRYSFINKAPIFFYTEGLIGTNSFDSLNYVSIYPLNYNFFKAVNDFVGQIGIEANQTFSNYRVSGNIYWNGILPNLVDFTFGEDRLRLKPVVHAGLKIYQEIKNSRPVETKKNELSNQIYGNLYYYIPIQKVYSLILEGTVFYDFNLKVNPNRKAMFNYSIIIGLDVPKTDFKTILKYSRGENGITYKQNDFIMIGFMSDLFNIK